MSRKVLLSPSAALHTHEAHARAFLAAWRSRTPPRPTRQPLSTSRMVSRCPTAAHCVSISPAHSSSLLAYGPASRAARAASALSSASPASAADLFLPFRFAFCLPVEGAYRLLQYGSEACFACTSPSSLPSCRAAGGTPDRSQALSR